jgi:hypothetical protein
MISAYPIHVHSIIISKSFRSDKIAPPEENAARGKADWQQA